MSICLSGVINIFKKLFLVWICIAEHYYLTYSLCLLNSDLTFSPQTRFVFIRITSSATTGKDWGFAIHARLSSEQWL